MCLYVSTVTGMTSVRIHIVLDEHNLVWHRYGTNSGMEQKCPTTLVIHQNQIILRSLNVS